jgi:hypothetical protein
MSFSKNANQIFEACIAEYHIEDHVDQNFENPHSKGTIEHLLYQKNWIDTVQWHVEDLIREPGIDADQGILYKRRIDQLNQYRTDTVEQIDDYFLLQFEAVELKANAKLNTESPAWAVDRLSILALKIYHMREQANRESLSVEKRVECQQKLDILLEQQVDLSQAIDELLDDLARGEKRMKVYRQMKMYNDPDLNPVLYGKSSSNQK